MGISLNNAVLGLMAAQRSLDVASHNISNSSTPGYSREDANLSETAPEGFVGAGMIGTGVQITSITRETDQFIAGQIYQTNAPLGEATVNSDTLKQVQDIFNEPSANGISAGLTAFFNAWQDLSTDPSNQSYRINLRDNASSLTQTIQSTYTKLTQLRRSANGEVQSTVGDINNLTKQIAQLNKQIQVATAAGENPNDLLDQQDQLITQLSNNAQIQVITNHDGTRNVYIGGDPLVDQNDSFQLSAQAAGNQGFFQIYMPIPPGSPPGTQPLQAQVTGGKLYGLLNARDNILSSTQPGGVIAQLNKLASTLVTTIDKQHQAGFGLTGNQVPFFDPANEPPIAPAPMDASNIAINPDFYQTTPNGLDDIAAATNDPGATNGGVSDAGNAIAIAQIQQQNIAGLGNTTFDSYYKTLITGIGSQTQQANDQVTTQTNLLTAVQNRQQQASGVNTDQEMANVVEFQKAYAASAKMLSTIQTLFDTLMSIKTD